MTGVPLNILVVEDDIALLEVMAAYLEESGFRVIKAQNAREFHQCIGRYSVDLILLDLELPDEDGLVVARQIQSRSQTPFMIVSARTGRDDRIAALEMGADDYVTKPFDPRELTLRIRNILERHGKNTYTYTPWNSQEDCQSIGPWRLNMGHRSLIHEDGRSAGLTRAEFDLLASLVLAKGRVKSRDALIDAVSYGNEPPSDRAIDVLVSRIRKKIETDPKKPLFVLTIPGHGYRLVIKT
ncbi:MAG: DNA-binding response regulator [Magnetococcales bacterium]|nr:DNA-binding response regulator [Magnetococcales bacterium]HIJ84165.1 response regulator transcription factor [Magnetococcales bacterium]